MNKRSLGGKRSGTRKTAAKPRQRFAFSSKLECIAPGLNYFALSIPKKVTLALGTRRAVPVLARVSGSKAFLASLYPVGGGRHYLRVRNKICREVKINEGDPVRVQIAVRDRTAEISIPKDVTSALRAESLEKEFKELPIGKKSYLLRLIEEAARPETRVKRIQDAVKEAEQRRERRADRRGG